MVSAEHSFPAGQQVAKAARRVFGPVASRRLGRSLGIDLLPHKTCSLDCIYCECGRTTDHRVGVDEFFPVSEIVRELDEQLAVLGPLDSVTFSGSGEPCLHSGIGDVILHLRRVHPDRRVTVLTNATPLHDVKVRARILEADRIVPSLDSATPEGFRRICRPHPDVEVDEVIEGLVALREEFHGELHLEIFVVPGINDTTQELSALRQAVDKIRPDLVQLNRLDRPGTLAGIARPDDAALSVIAKAFAPIPVSWVPERRTGGTPSSGKGDVVAWLETHAGADVAAISLGTGLREGDVSKILHQCIDQGLVLETSSSGATPDLYRAT